MRNVNIRILGVTVAIAVVIAAIVVIATAGGSTRPNPDDIASLKVETGPPQTGRFDPHATTAKTVVVTDAINGVRYSVRTFRNERGEACVELVQGTSDVTGACGPVPSAEHVFGASITDQSPGDGQRLVVGVIWPTVSSVQSQTPAGADVSQVHAADKEVAAYAVKLANAGAAASVTLRARDAAGAVMATHNASTER